MWRQLPERVAVRAARELQPIVQQFGEFELCDQLDFLDDLLTKAVCKTSILSLEPKDGKEFIIVN